MSIPLYVGRRAAGYLLVHLIAAWQLVETALLTRDSHSRVSKAWRPHLNIIGFSFFCDKSRLNRFYKHALSLCVSVSLFAAAFFSHRSMFFISLNCFPRQLPLCDFAKELSP